MEVSPIVPVKMVVQVVVAVLETLQSALQQLDKGIMVVLDIAATAPTMVLGAVVVLAQLVVPVQVLQVVTVVLDY